MMSLRRSHVRHFPNTLKDHDASTSSSSSMTPSNFISESFRCLVRSKRVELLSLLESQDLETHFRGNGSVYVGLSGIAYLYLHLYQHERHGERSVWLQRANYFCKKALRRVHRLRGPAFLLGQSGPVALAAIIAHYENRAEESREHVDHLLSLLPSALESSTPDELLYGRVGYLYALLVVEKHLRGSIPDNHLHTLVQSVINHGHVDKEDGQDFPLMWYFHGKAYLGPAHGVSGILDLLLQVFHLLDDRQQQQVQLCIQVLVKLGQMPSGNFGSSLPLHDDKLVHWCHGAPGVIHLLIRAANMFPHQRDMYVQSALRCGEVIWSRGLLKKGYGLCHGAPGNAYGLFALHKLTQDPKWLHRGLQFASWCLQWGHHGCQVPDDPLSLMNGLAGTIVFLLDVEMDRAHLFPCYHIV